MGKQPKVGDSVDLNGKTHKILKILPNKNSKEIKRIKVAVIDD